MGKATRKRVLDVGVVARQAHGEGLRWRVRSGGRAVVQAWMRVTGAERWEGRRRQGKDPKIRRRAGAGPVRQWAVVRGADGHCGTVGSGVPVCPVTWSRSLESLSHSVRRFNMLPDASTASPRRRPAGETAALRTVRRARSTTARSAATEPAIGSGDSATLATGP